MLDFEWDQDKALDVRFQEGREQNQRDTAVEMLKSKLALPLIMQCTKLSESVVRNLAKVHGLAVL